MNSEANGIQNAASRVDFLYMRVSSFWKRSSAKIIIDQEKRRISIEISFIEVRCGVFDEGDIVIYKFIDFNIS